MDFRRFALCLRKWVALTLDWRDWSFIGSNLMDLLSRLRRCMEHFEDTTGARKKTGSDGSMPTCYSWNMSAPAFKEGNIRRFTDKCNWNEVAQAEFKLPAELRFHFLLWFFAVIVHGTARPTHKEIPSDAASWLPGNEIASHLLRSEGIEAAEASYRKEKSIFCSFAAAVTAINWEVGESSSKLKGKLLRQGRWEFFASQLKTKICQLHDSCTIRFYL